VFLESTAHSVLLAEQDSIQAARRLARGLASVVFREGADGFASTNDSRSAVMAAWRGSACWPGSAAAATPPLRRGSQPCAITAEQQAGWIIARLGEATSRLLEGPPCSSATASTARAATMAPLAEVMVAPVMHRSPATSALHQSWGSMPGRRWEAPASPGADDMAARSPRMTAPVGPRLRRRDSAQRPRPLLRAITSKSAAPVVMANRFGGVIFPKPAGHLLETTPVGGAPPLRLSRWAGRSPMRAVTAIDGPQRGAFGSFRLETKAGA